MSNKASISLFALLLVAVLLIAAGARRYAVVKAQNQSLRSEVAELKQAWQAAANRPENSDNSSQAQARAEKLELMRLRNEVTQLRASNQAITAIQSENARLVAENQQLQSQAGNPAHSLPGGALSKQQWAFKGFATPESSLESGLWALREGRLATALEWLTPEERLAFEQQNQGKSESEMLAQLTKSFGKISGVRVLAQQQTAPNEVLLDVYLEGPGRVRKLRMNQVGQEWKAGAPVVQSTVANTSTSDQDPMAFYRKNPELMKRYFPHLFREGEPQPSNP